jgi:hypothetical protein
MALLLPPTYKFKYFFSFRNLIVGGLLVILTYDVALFISWSCSIFSSFVFVVVMILQI